jgi:DNA-3-methyladenine glycosylase II
MLDGRPVETSVVQEGAPDSARLRVAAAGSRLGASVEPAVRSAVERMLGLRVDLRGFYRRAAGHRRLRRLAERFRGVKPPRFPTVFESLINAFACQQLSLTVGIILLNRLTERYGTARASGGRAVHAFPEPADLAAARPGPLRRLGFSGHKAQAILGLATAAAAHRIDLECIDDLDDDAAVARLEELRGVGRWSAEYVLLRGLGRYRVFPVDDVGARNNVAKWLALRRTLDAEGVARVLARWSPYAGLIYFHLLLDRLAEAGLLGESADV